MEVKGSCANITPKFRNAGSNELDRGRHCCGVREPASWPLILLRFVSFVKLSKVNSHSVLQGSLGTIVDATLQKWTSMLMQTLQKVVGVGQDLDPRRQCSSCFEFAMCPLTFVLPQERTLRSLTTQTPRVQTWRSKGLKIRCIDKC